LIFQAITFLPKIILPICYGYPVQKITEFRKIILAQFISRAIAPQTPSLKITLAVKKIILNQ
jgi:hypothetical protein